LPNLASKTEKLSYSVKCTFISRTV